jgi:hypothetical protein
MPKEIPMPNDETVLRKPGGGSVWQSVFFVMMAFVLSAGSLYAEIQVKSLDWESACGGSAIEVTSKDGQILIIEAFAEHFAESREWVCIFKDGVLSSACYRHHTLKRKQKGDSGEIEIERILDRVETFAAEGGTLKNLPTNLQSDLDDLLHRTRESLSKPQKP